MIRIHHYRKSTQRGVVAVVVVALAGVGAAVGVASATAGEGSTVANGAVVAVPNFTVNQRGQTVGKLDGLASRDYPDLVQVVATNGKIGYVDSKLVNELTGGNVQNPEEAMAWQRQHEAWLKTHPGPRFVPVYESDGLIVIGQFQIGGGAGPTAP